MEKKVIKKIEIDKIRAFLKTTPLFIAKHVFYFSLLMFALSLIVGISILFDYNIIFYNVMPSEMGDLCSLDQEVYTKIKTIWENDIKVFENASSRDYYNIFSN